MVDVGIDKKFNKTRLKNNLMQGNYSVKMLSNDQSNMINLKKFLLTASFVLIATSPAKADWQFTKWGMSSTELQKISPVQLESGNNCPVNNSNGSTNSPYDVKYSSKWTVGSMNFIACYLFLNNKLHIINLFSFNVDREAVIKGLSQKYGQPKINNILKEVGIVTYEWDLPEEKIEFSIQERLKYPYVVSYSSKAGSNENSVREGL